jgi:hypothetical protein
MPSTPDIFELFCAPTPSPPTIWRPATSRAPKAPTAGQPAGDPPLAARGRVGGRAGVPTDGGAEGGLVGGALRQDALAGFSPSHRPCGPRRRAGEGGGKGGDGGVRASFEGLRTEPVL